LHYSANGCIIHFFSWLVENFLSSWFPLCIFKRRILVWWFHLATGSFVKYSADQCFTLRRVCFFRNFFFIFSGRSAGKTKMRETFLIDGVTGPSIADIFGFLRPRDRLLSRHLPVQIDSNPMGIIDDRVCVSQKAMAAECPLTAGKYCPSSTTSSGQIF
jgi:hypothetical protein